MILPIGIVAAYYLRRSLQRKDWLRWSSQSTYSRLAETLKEKSNYTWLLWVAFFLLVIAAVNPQWGYKTKDVESKTADIYLLLDISNSMLAEDVAPSRLERARRLALELSSSFKTDRVGLIVFAGNAYIQSPLTTDWHAIQLYLNAVHPNQAGTQGTVIGEAVRLAKQLRNEDEKSRGGALIVITDGEDHDSEAPAAIQEARAEGWITYIIGVGTETGSTIPMEVDGRKDIKRDDSGQPVHTKMNRPLMIDLAQQGGGKYFDLTTDKTIIDDLKDELSVLERSQMEKRSFSEHRSYYQWFLMTAMMIFLLYTVLRYKHEVI
ncbi:MAG: VWA domain-containing protein [Saprospiraceae bacterium]